MPKGKGAHKFSIPQQMPVLPILSVVVFPFAIVQLLVRRDRNVTLLRSLKGTNQIIALVAPKKFDNAEPAPKDLHEYGVAAKIVSKEEVGEDTFQIALQGLCRIRVKKYTQEDPFLVAEITEVVEKELEDLETKVLMENLIELFNRFVSENSRYSSEIVRIVEMNLDEGPSVITDLIASYINFKMEEKQHILETLDVKLRMRKLIEYLGKEIDFLKVEGEIQSKARQEMEKSQREYFLRRQLDEIKKELGEDDQANTDLLELKEKLKKKKFPKETMEVIKKELSRLERLSKVAADYHVIRTYLDWLIELPWEQTTEDMLNIHQAKKILDEDHYGLEKVKERILEYLAVLKLKKDLKGPILCFVGPPGVGKTSLGQSIARAMNRKFMRISLGGVKDEAEIRGHRRTYVGALPGRIIQGIKKAGTSNPLFMIDEIDKISGERGDPSSALLEVLDPAQNNTFKDNYIEIPFDLSQVMFITTANLLDPIPEPLKDRMEVIKLSGYTLEEKVIIANDHIIPRQIKEHGLTREKIHFTDEAVKLIVKGYTREAGVRNLERELSHVCRKVAKEIAEGANENFIIKANNLSRYLGPKKMFEDEALQTSEVGIAQGLAWNEAGGALLHIETTKIP
jgi:ATP-dependent Lon protease